MNKRIFVTPLECSVTYLKEAIKETELEITKQQARLDALVEVLDSVSTFVKFDQDGGIEVEYK